jgi:hypothetical protein
VSDKRAMLEAGGERVERADTDAEVLSERVTTDEELPLTDREIDVVNVANGVEDIVLTFERDTIEVTDTIFEYDGTGDIDRIAEEDWLTRTLDETVPDSTTDVVTRDVDDTDLEIVVRGELLEVAVELKVIKLENVGNGEGDKKLVFVFIIE